MSAAPAASARLAMMCGPFTGWGWGDCIAAGAAVRLFESATGKQIGEPLTHTLEITDLALNQVGAVRRVAL
eukprot:9290019-Pyramimonas_sp.AAC.1